MSAIHESLEPSVIDVELLKKLLIEQAPAGEAGKVLLTDGIILEEVRAIRLENLNILRINNLWMMTSLVKLQLSLNIIQKIENLDSLINLIELDLSFNEIEVLENLTNLKKLEIFSVYSNKIKKLENMNNLIHLRFFSIGNNSIADMNNVVYLRRFCSLHSLNMEGNPCAEEDSFKEYIYACLPAISYYNYRFIFSHVKEAAQNKYREILTEIEETEAKAAEHLKCEKNQEIKLEFYTAAFVEYLDDDQLFTEMFENDENGQSLLKMDDDVITLYKEFHDEFCNITKKLFKLGLEQHKIREAEILELSKCAEGAKARNAAEIEKMMSTFIERKSLLFKAAKTAVEGDVRGEQVTEDCCSEIDHCSTEVNNLCSSTLTDFMASELVLNNQLKNVNEQFEDNLRKLVAVFIRGSQALFTECCGTQKMFSEQLSELAYHYLTKAMVKGEDPGFSMPPELKIIMTDKVTLSKATKTSHDHHIQVINNREDKLMMKVNNWTSELCADIHRNEIKRYRSKINQFIHFFNIQKKEFEELVCEAFEKV